jgi:uncharacterized protein (TIGR03437 family)
MNLNRKALILALGIVGLVPTHLAAQLSNSSVQGAYFVRQVAMSESPTNYAYSAQGIATFDGKGNFSFQGTSINTANGATTTAQNLTLTGTYYVTSGGIFSMTSLIDTAETVFGGFASNIIVTSSTESSYYDLLVGIPVSQTVSNGTLNGNYRFVSIDFLNGQYGSVRNGTFTAAANGQGSLGNLSITGQAANLTTATTTQSISGATYTLSSNGSGTLTLPTSGSATSQLITGNKTLYTTSDGSLVLGGSANGYDMILGVKALTGSASAATFQGLYFTGGLELDNTGGDLANSSQLQGYSGSIKADGKGTYISDNRFNLDGSGAYDQTLASPNSIPTASGLLDVQTAQYYFGANGQIFVGTGQKGNYEIDLAVRAPNFTSTGGVFLDPTGVLNAASFAPITNPIAPGELITLFGSGLAKALTVAPGLPFPTTLGGVQVTINGTAAPIYYVSPTQVSVIAPYSIPTDGSFAEVQVTNNGVQSNTVELYTSPTAPGIFSQSQSGTGTGAILRQNSTVVSSGNPAIKGETIQIFLTGLGVVSPTSPAGAAGPSDPLSKVTGNLQVFIDGYEATPSYAGLAPGLAGLYQINVVVPATVSSGDVYVDIATDDAYHTQVTLPVK